MATTTLGHRNESMRLVLHQALHLDSRSGIGVVSFLDSHDAQLHRLAQAGQRVAERDELVGHVALEADVGDGAGDGLVVQLLGLVDLVPAGVAAGVVVAEVRRGLS